MFPCAEADVPFRPIFGTPRSQRHARFRLPFTFPIEGDYWVAVKGE